MKFLMQATESLFDLFARLLDYPTSTLLLDVEDCLHILAASCPPADERLTGFHKFVEETTAAKLEEIYTNTFDLQGTCCPYVGHYLFGENIKRSRFMSSLNAEYKARSFDPKSELPDHVAVILRFLGRGEVDEFCHVLLVEGLIPAVDKMIRAIDENGNNPYKLVLQGLWMVIQMPNSPVSIQPGGFLKGGTSNA